MMGTEISRQVWRFIERLATWLQQFEAEERETAYGFIRRSLVYIGPSELQRLVEQFYPRTVRDRLFSTVARSHGIPPFRVLTNPDSLSAIKRLRRQTLFMGLSDGARIDTIRHTNSDILSNEQLVQSTQVDLEKWKDLLDNLRNDLEDDSARFRMVYLIDDFAGTGTSFIRYDEKRKQWKGKLRRFKESVENASAALVDDDLFEPEWELCIHHYVASSAAAGAIRERLEEASAVMFDGWCSTSHSSFGMLLPCDLPINAAREGDKAFVELTEKYYDPVIRTKHTDVGGVTHLGLGYGGCALPLVLEHNTPNNSVALLWAETDGGCREGVVARPMRPLFRRRQRHS